MRSLKFKENEKKYSSNFVDNYAFISLNSITSVIQEKLIIEFLRLIKSICFIRVLSLKIRASGVFQHHE